MRVILPMPGNEAIAQSIARKLGVACGVVEWRRFPDEEAYIRIASDVRGAHVDVVCTLANPDPQFLSLVFLAETARELGAASIGLIAPYLAYMRQDVRFNEGEAISSLHFARLLSRYFDRVTTIDPHLHRIGSLDEIFSIPTRVVTASAPIADWIGNRIERPILIGPDQESEQWIAAIAARAQAPYVVAHKTRLGDRRVLVELPDISAWRGHTPVLIDDIVSSGGTMLSAAHQLIGAGLGKPCCVVVHALFAEGVFEALQQAASQIVSTDTVAHASNEISVAEILTSNP